MDPKRISKKRKLPPASYHPMIGIYTRTKSQIHQSSFSHDDAELRFLIKDLRTRRVFSPKSIHADQNVGSVYMGSHGTVAAENMKDISTVLSSIDEESWFDKNPYNDESEEVDVNGKKGSSEKSDGDGEYVGLVKAIGEVNEESVQTTAPDGKVFDDGAVNEKWRMDLFPQINPRRSECRQVLYGFSRYSGGGGYEGYKHGFVFNCGGVPVG